MSTQYNDIFQDGLDSEESPALSQSLRTFGGMVLLSAMLHLGVALYLTIAPQGVASPGGPVFEVALSEPTPASSMTTPPEAPPAAEEPLLPETIQEQPEATASPAPEVSSPVMPDMAPSSLMFGISSGAFASFGDGKTLKEDIRPYFLEILERINASWKKEGAGVKLSSPVMLLLSVERSGEVRTVQTLQSSGNPFHDRLLARAVRNAGPFPAVPESYSAPSFETPLRFNPPLSLMSFGVAPASIPPH